MSHFHSSPNPGESSGPDPLPLNKATPPSSLLAEQLGLKLPAGLPPFEPTRRQAILVNSWDELQGAEPLSIAEGFCRGSRHVYELEGLFSGKLSVPDCGEHTAVVEGMVKGMFAEDVGAFRSSHPYDVRTVHSYTGEPWERIQQNARELSALSDDRTLTLFYIESHGAFGSIYMGKELIPYRSVFAVLDEIPGRKLVVVMGCYSGSALLTLNNSPKRSDYVLVSTSRPECRTTNWADDDLQLSFYNQVWKTQPLSEWILEVSKHAPLEDGPNGPQISGAFNVIL